MTIKLSLQIGAVVLLLILIGTIRSCMIKPTPFKPKHIVLIGIDTLRADEVKKLGPTYQWAEQNATIYQNAYTTSPWTFPAFASLLTGMYPSKVGATQYNMDTVLSHREPEISRLDRYATTIPEFMKSSGFKTVGLSNSIWLSKMTGLDRGFDVFRQFENERCVETIVQAEHQAEMMVEDDYFMFIHLMDPHLPYHPLKPDALRTIGNYEGRFETQAGSLRSVIGPPEDVTPEERKRMRQLYRGDVNYTGKRLMALIEYFTEQDADTLIIITSDHGEEFWEHGGFEHGHTMYDELLRVPLIVYADGMFWPNYDNPVSLIDVFPSILMWAEIDTGHSTVMDGRPLQSLIDWDRALYHEGMLYGPRRQAITYQGYRMVLTYDEGSADSGTLEMWNGVVDKPMKTPLNVETHPLGDEMLKMLFSWKVDCDSYSANEREFVGISDQDRDELKSIGYLGGS